MLINDAVFSAVNNNIKTNPTGKQEEADNSLNRVMTSANADISTAGEGESFNGTVTDINGDRVSLLLDNNKLLNASLSDGISLNIGDMLTFRVKENNGTSVLIKPVVRDANAMKDGTIFKILETNGFSPTQKNYDIAEALLNNSMPVDKGSMQKLMQQAYKYPDASIDTLVALNKLNMPVNETNITQYEDYINNRHQLTGNLGGLAEAVVNLQVELLNEPASGEVNFQSILKLNGDILQAISDESDVANMGELMSGEAATEEGLLGEAALTESGALTEEAVISGGIEDFADRASADKNRVSDLMGRLRELGVEETDINRLLNKSDSAISLLNNINELLGRFDELPPERLKDFFAGREYGAILKQAMNEKMTLNPSGMESPSEIDEVYKSIYDKTNRLLNAFGGSGGPAGQQLEQQAGGVQDRLDFIQNLNNMYAYAQIPVRLDKNELNSELFVYMNKKGIRDSKDAVSALLHLDMEHLGATDVHVSLHGGIVHTRFYVEDEESARIIDEHMSMLEKAINESGYQLTNEVINREASDNKQINAVVNEMFDSELEKSVKRYSFDVRT